MHAFSLRISLLLSLALLGACAGETAQRAPAASAAAPSQLSSLDERTALALIDELLREARWQPVSSWLVAVPPRSELEVDLRLGDTGFGIEWVSADDRHRYGPLLPPPGPGGQLRVMTGTEGDDSTRVQILVLDHESYRFAARSPDAVGEYDLHDVEQQLRRDLTEFIEYARSQ